ncbi:MAG: GMC oxidoreductase [Acidimicrobiales bacterium]
MPNHHAPDMHFDTVIVGSGFGGSVTAYRFAQEGERVLVLERGKAYPPGSFARRPREMKDNFWDPSKGQHGLFNVWSFRGIEALVASGLGGGSLIYANVLLRKDERWFVKDAPFGGGYEHWPIDRADLEPHYDAVERMLAPTPFPLAAPGYGIPKTLATQEAAAALGLHWRLPPLAVTFSPDADSPPAPGVPIVPGPYPNLHGRPRLTCRLCGECNIGCNEGSKNTLDHTYLSAAAHHGAEIRTRSEVRGLASRPGGGYEVAYVEHSPDREGKRTGTGKLPTRTVTADRLVLAAGALGTPYLLLRSRAAFPNLSAALGTRFSGNGDLLSLVLKSRLPPPLGTARVMDASRGPVITSAIRVPDAADGDGAEGRGYYVEDAGYPVLVDWLAQGADVPGTLHRLVRFALRRAWGMVARSPVSDLGSEVGGLLGRAELSSTSLPLLGMGRDVPDGVMRLRKGWLDVDWTIATSKDFFERVRSTMHAVSDHLGGRFADNPLWLLKKVVTVHPLGGAPMGRHPGEGVVDAYGEVFGHPGLYVADGAAMPGPVGANPCLTIAAFADRLADHALERKPLPTRAKEHQ